jgi:hypothetical protein
MEETGGNPRLFVEYTKKFDSLNVHTDLLCQREQEETLSLQKTQDNIRVADSRLREVNAQINEAKIELAAVNRKVKQAKQKENESARAFLYEP